MVDSLWAEVAALVQGGGHVTYTNAAGEYVGGLWVSSDGMDEMVAQARAMEAHRDRLDALTPYLGRCEHGLDVAELMEHEGWQWSINDYYCYAHGHRDTELLFMLGGFHDHEWDGIFGGHYRDVYCIPWAFNAAGVLYPYEAVCARRYG